MINVTLDQVAAGAGLDLHVGVTGGLVTEIHHSILLRVATYDRPP